MHKTVVYVTINWMQTWIDIKLLLIEFHGGVAAEGRGFQMRSVSK
jgi:hypothetical protein